MCWFLVFSTIATVSNFIVDIFIQFFVQNVILLKATSSNFQSKLQKETQRELNKLKHISVIMLPERIYD